MIALAALLAGCGVTVPVVEPLPPPAMEPVPEPEPTFDELPREAQIEALRGRGEEVYLARCARCHQEDGKGLRGAFPPLLGPGQVRGACSQHGALVREGLIGEIVADGVTYNSVMPPTALNDFDLAALLTYERTAWGNALSPCLPADVVPVATAVPAPG